MFNDTSIAILFLPGLGLALSENNNQYNWALISPFLHQGSEVHLNASAAQMQ